MGGRAFVWVKTHPVFLVYGFMRERSTANSIAIGGCCLILVPELHRKEKPYSTAAAAAAASF